MLVKILLKYIADIIVLKRKRYKHRRRIRFLKYKKSLNYSRILNLTNKRLSYKNSLIRLTPSFNSTKRAKAHFSRYFILSTNVSKRMRLNRNTYLKSERTKKITFERVFSRTTQIRRLGRRLFNYAIINSKKFSIFYNAFLYFTTHHPHKLPYTIGLALLTSKIFSDLKEILWVLKSKFVLINTKGCSNFFHQLVLGDVISFKNSIYFLHAIIYFLQISKKWFVRKSRKWAKTINQFMNTNKGGKYIDPHYKRWLKVQKSAPVNYYNYEIDYRIFSIILFRCIENRLRLINLGWLRFLLSPLKHTYIWGYKW